MWTLAENDGSGEEAPVSLQEAPLITTTNRRSSSEEREPGERSALTRCDHQGPSEQTVKVKWFASRSHVKIVVSLRITAGVEFIFTLRFFHCGWTSSATTVTITNCHEGKFWFNELKASNLLLPPQIINRHCLMNRLTMILIGPSVLTSDLQTHTKVTWNSS